LLLPAVATGSRSFGRVHSVRSCPQIETIVPNASTGPRPCRTLSQRHQCGNSQRSRTGDRRTR
jgi:hypothetical protein